MAKRGYELWNLSTGNCVGFYESEAAALADVAFDACENGRGVAEELGLSSPTKSQSLSGRALVDKALASQGQRKSA